jgi:pimeloyl-ACP methyl ester carboxylesterase
VHLSAASYFAIRKRPIRSYVLIPFTWLSQRRAPYLVLRPLLCGFAVLVFKVKLFMIAIRSFARSSRVLVFWVFLLIPVALRAQQSDTWKYDLRTGDHLVYRYTFERDTKDSQSESRIRLSFNSHVLVVGEQESRISLGFQRNRESAELLRYLRDGKDVRPEEQAKFERDMTALPEHFAEANEVSRKGVPLDPWQVDREVQSKLLMSTHEIEGLPQTAPTEEDHPWKGSNTLDMDFQLTGTEDVLGVPCQRSEGTGGGGTVRLTYLWCPATGVLGKVTFSGQYEAGGATVHERVSFELLEKRRGESLAQWLNAADTEKGALESMLLSRWIAIDGQALDAPLRSPSAELQSLALACLYQRNLPPPDRHWIEKLSQSSDAEVKRIAARVLQAAATPAPTWPRGCPPTRQLVRPEQETGTSLRFMQAKGYVGVPYILHVPKDYRGDQPFPMIIYLAGGGGMALDAVNTSSDSVAKSEYLVLYPQAADLWWNESIPEMFEALLNEVLQNLNVDTNRVYLSGFSEGGTAALLYATLWPQRFAALVSQMGAGTCMMDVASALPQLTNLPLLLVHGEKDRRVPPHCSTDTYEALRKLHPKEEPQLHILKDREHDVTLNADDGATLAFFANKARDVFPKDVTARVSETSFPRRYWIEIMAKGGGWAEVDGHILANNTVQLTTTNVSKVRLLLRPELFSSPGQIQVEINGRRVFEGPLKQDCELLEKSSAYSGDPLLGYTDQMDFEIQP